MISPRNAMRSSHRPGALDVGEQLRGRLANGCGPEDRILILSLGRGQLDAPLALAALTAVRAALLGARVPEAHERREAAAS